MKKIILATVLLVAVTAAQAEPGLFFGVTYNFNELSQKSFTGGKFGATAKILSSRDHDKGVVALGASYFPTAKAKFGVDVGAGYQGNDIAGIVSYDILQKGYSLSGGFTNSTDDDSCTLNKNKKQPRCLP